MKADPRTDRILRGLLAILLLRTVAPDARLIDGLWGEQSPPTAAKTTQVYVSKLRKALGDGVLLRRGGGYMLDTTGADRFRELAAGGRRALADGDLSTANDTLARALALWRPGSDAPAAPRDSGMAGAVKRVIAGPRPSTRERNREVIRVSAEDADVNSITVETPSGSRCGVVWIAESRRP